MRKLDLGRMDFDELWALLDELTNILADKISTENRKLKKRLLRTEPSEGH